MQPEPERTGPAARRDTIRGILFDKDGPLLDFPAIWLPACRRGAGVGRRVAVLTGAGSRAVLEPLADHVLASIEEIDRVLPPSPSGARGRSG